MSLSFNNKANKPLTYIIIGGVSIIFVLTGMSSVFRVSSNSADNVAKIGNTEITSQQLQRYIKPEMDKTQKLNVLNQLVKQKMMFVEAKSQNLQAGKLAIQSVIFNDPSFQEKGKFSNKKLQELAKYVGGISHLELLIKNNILTNSINMAIAQSSFILNSENKSLNKLFNQTRNISLLKINQDDLEKNLKPTEKELKIYFNENQDEYMTKATAEVKYYTLSTKDFISKDKISEQEIQNYYNNNKDLFKTLDDKSKETIIKILKNRQALVKYNNFISNPTINNFNSLKSKLGNSKAKTIENIPTQSINGIDNTLFFSVKNNYGIVPTSDTSSIFYYIEETNPSKLKTFDSVKQIVLEDYKKQALNNLFNKEVNKVIKNSNNGKLSKYKFIKANINISSDKKYPFRFIYNVINSANNSKYHSYIDGKTAYIYKTDKITYPTNTVSTNNYQLKQAYEMAEFNYYNDILKTQISVEINKSKI